MLICMNKQMSGDLYIKKKRKCVTSDIIQQRWFKQRTYTNCLCKKLKVTESNDINHNVLFIFINLIVPYGSTFPFYKNVFNFDITPYKAYRSC